MKDQKRIAIIGAGIAGLSAAYELTKAGHDVTVYEKDSVVGGRMATDTTEGLQFNSGATFLSENYTQLKKYSDEFGIPWTQMEQGSSHRIIRNGREYPLGLKGPLDVFRLGVISIRARIALFRTLIQMAIRPPQGDFFDLTTVPMALSEKSAQEHLYRHVHRDVADYLADSFTGALHFHRTDEISSGVLLSLMRMMLGNKNFSARHPKGGVRSIPLALASRVRVVTSADIKSITPATNSTKAALHTGESTEVFDAVIAACPAPAARSLLVDPTEAQKDLLNSIEYASTMTLAVKVPVGFFADTTHCIYVPFVENPIICSAIYEARKGAELTHGGSTLLSIYLYDHGARVLAPLSREEKIARILTEFKKVCPEARAREHEMTVHSLKEWNCAMPKFTAQLVRAVQTFVRDGHQGTGDIYFIGDYMGSPWTEGAARSGVRMAAQLLERFTT